MPADTSRARALALSIVWKFSQEFCIRRNFASSFRADLTTHAWCKSLSSPAKAIVRLFAADSRHLPELVRLRSRGFAVVKTRHVLDLRGGDVKFVVRSPA